MFMGDGLHITERGHPGSRETNATFLVERKLDSGVSKDNQSSIWVRWITHNHLRHKSVWTVDVKGGSWGWRKLLRLRSALLPYIDLKIGDGESFSLWHDPWHSLGPLIQRFPCGPSRTNIPAAATLSTVIVDGAWCWPLITDMECIEITHMLPTIHNGSDSILWRGGDFSTKVVYDIFRSPGPKLFSAVHPSIEEHCSLQLAEPCMGEDITWASKRYMGRHIVQAAYRALLAAIVYHIWQERNQRVFRHITRTSSTIARNAIDAIRQKILSIELLDSVSSEDYIDFGESPGLSGIPLDASEFCSSSFLGNNGISTGYATSSQSRGFKGKLFEQVL
ncbi:hypothetical protein Sango_3085000 [Sesamum angolense]|uniref:Reverse transcriptase zinc-binding domain-containing protein n=1 Tax=Sesamum angolense TaxID=2727404 RepID=A0AAE1T9Y6_9LAMI|nr:hypothetical protein Sango_3085000 [Sesamum angolense]